MNNIIKLFFALNIISISALSQNALHFDGVNDYVQTNYYGISGTNARTVEAWIRVPNTTAALNGAIVSWGTNLASQKSTFRIQSNNGTIGAIRYEVNGGYIVGSTDLRDGLWHHVAVTWSNDGTPSVTDSKLYVDGVLEITSAQLGWAVNTGSSYALTIGKKQSNSDRFEGEIDELRIWSTDRTQSEIQSNMNSEFCVIPANLEAYYKFNHGTASGTNTGITTANDNSGNGNTGTLTSFSLSGSTSNWVTGSGVSTNVFTGGTTSVSSCVPYTSPGNQILTTAGTYQDTFLTISGCDSIYTLNFTPLQNSFGTISPIACDMYTTPSGISITSSGTYSDTIPNVLGCDSIITINLTVNQFSDTTLNITECNSFTSPLGSVITTSGTYVDTLQNAIGCDSLVFMNVTIFTTVPVVLNETACDSYTSPSGKIWSATGTYLDTIDMGASCDTVFTINLSIINSTTSTIYESGCYSYTSANGMTYTSSGKYTEVVPNAVGCDSVITLNITIDTVDVSVTVNGSTLKAVNSAATYRWLNCDNNYSPISGANQQSFTPTTSGNYAVKIDDGDCVDTSLCINVVLTGIADIQNTKVNLFPNPSVNNLTVQTSNQMESIVIMDLTGRQVKFIGNLSNNTFEINTRDLISGVYFLKVTTTEGTVIRQFVKE